MIATKYDIEKGKEIEQKIRKNMDKVYFYSLIDVMYQVAIDAYEDSNDVNDIDNLENEISRFIIDWGKLDDEYKERLV